MFQAPGKDGVPDCGSSRARIVWSLAVQHELVLSGPPVPPRVTEFSHEETLEPWLPWSQREEYVKHLGDPSA